MLKLEVALLIAAAIGMAPSAFAACPQGDLGAFPVLVDDIEVRPYSSENISTTSPATQKNCVFLENTSAATVSPVLVESQLEEAGTGVIGPWSLASFSSINISGGVPVTCSTVGDVARTAPSSGSLAGGAITDICCFVWEAESPGSCTELPQAGDLAQHSIPSGSGAEAEMVFLSYIPVGGTTCGLVGIEILIFAPLLRRWRRRS